MWSDSAIVYRRFQQVGRRYPHLIVKPDGCYFVIPADRDVEGVMAFTVVPLA
jgi:hypothetical protein